MNAIELELPGGLSAKLASDSSITKYSKHVSEFSRGKHLPYKTTGKISPLFKDYTLRFPCSSLS